MCVKLGMWLKPPRSVCAPCTILDTYNVRTCSVDRKLYHIQQGTLAILHFGRRMNCKVMQSGAKWHKVVQNGTKWYKVVHASATTGQHVANRSLPPSPHLLLLLVHTTQNMHKQICLN